MRWRDGYRSIRLRCCAVLSMSTLQSLRRATFCRRSCCTSCSAKMCRGSNTAAVHGYPSQPRDSGPNSSKGIWTMIFPACARKVGTVDLNALLDPLQEFPVQLQCYVLRVSCGACCCRPHDPLQYFPTAGGSKGHTPEAAEHGFPEAVTSAPAPSSALRLLAGSSISGMQVI